MEMEETDVWAADGGRPSVESAPEGIMEDTARACVPQQSSDSSSDSDYDEQLARKIQKQRDSYQGSDPDSFLSNAAAVTVAAAAAPEASAPQAMAPRALSAEDRSDSSAAKLGSSMPINIPALTGRLSGDGDSDMERHATFIPPHLIEQQKEARLFAGGVSITGMSPSTSLKRDRLMQRNAILRRTGFIESGVPLKGTFAEVLDPIKEARVFDMPSGGLSMALGSSPSNASALSSSLKEKSALSQALGTSPSQQ